MGAALHRVVIAITVLGAACGRIGFDGLDDSGTGDGRRDSAPGVEVCNGVDDDGNGTVDDGCPCTPFDITPTFADDEAIAFTGTELLVLHGSVLERVGIDGVIGPPYGAFNPNVLRGAQSMAWNGSRIALAYGFANQQYFQLFDPTDGSFGFSPILDSDPAAGTPAIVWTGSQFAEAFTSGSTVTLFEISADGASAGPKITVPLTASIASLVLYPTPTGYALLDTATTDVVFVDRPAFVAQRYTANLGGAIGPFSSGVGPTGILMSGAQTTVINEMQIIQFDGTFAKAADFIPSGPTGERLEYANANGSPTGYWLTGQYATTNLTLETVEVDVNQIASGAQAFGAFAIQDRATVTRTAATATRRMVALGYDDSVGVARVWIHQHCLP